MKLRNIFKIILPAILIYSTACNNADKKAAPMEPKLKEESITYTGDSATMNGYIVYDENKEGARPAVLIVHEWWGLNDYPKMRARELAKLGYTAMAIDLFGGQVADSPALAMKLTEPFYKNPQKAKERFDAALNKLKTYSQVDTSKIAAIGYCFGGTQVLNVAKLGDNLKGVVSFHGGALSALVPQKDVVKADVLVCHGAADQFVPQSDVDAFKKQMDSVGAKYTLKVYEGATHAFTNPAATENGKKFNLPIAYNAAADTASWNDMKSFFDKIFK